MRAILPARIIMLSGKPGVGKDTVADILVNRFGYVKYSFANQLIKYATDLYGLPEVYFTNRKLKDRPIESLGSMTPRDILIYIARIMKREDKNVFVRPVVNSIMETDKPVVISDHRFKHEREYIESIAGLSDLVSSIYIIRHGIDQVIDSSDITINDCDHLIINNEDIKKLESILIEMHNNGAI